MSFVTAQTEALASAAAELTAQAEGMVACLGGANVATTVISPAAADPVSLALSQMLAAHATVFQSTLTGAAAQHSAAAGVLGGNADSYALAEATNAALAG